MLSNDPYNFKFKESKLHYYYDRTPFLFMKKVPNTTIYDSLEDKWYSGEAPFIELLKLESEFKNPWVEKILTEKKSSHILDLGCGGGFLSNYLGQKHFNVTGIDISSSSLEIAKKYDTSQKVNYILGDIHSLPFEDQSFDAICAMDILEHIEDYPTLLKECSRILRPGGIFLFHTFSKNLLSWLIVIKGMEIFYPTAPKDLHLYEYFISPKDLISQMNQNHLKLDFIKGTGPIIWKSLFQSFIKRRSFFIFEFKPVTWCGYLGYSTRK